MTKADQIRKLRADGLEPDQIAEQVGLSVRRVQTQFWTDDNRERRREQAQRWQAEARRNPSYRLRERETQKTLCNARYREDEDYRKKVLARSADWRRRQSEARP